MSTPQPYTDEELAHIEQQLDKLSFGSISRSRPGEVDLPYMVRIVSDLVASDIPRLISMVRAQNQEIETLRAIHGDQEATR